MWHTFRGGGGAGPRFVTVCDGGGGGKNHQKYRDILYGRPLIRLLYVHNYIAIAIFCEKIHLLDEVEKSGFVMIIVYKAIFLILHSPSTSILASFNLLAMHDTTCFNDSHPVREQSYTSSIVSCHHHRHHRRRITTTNRPSSWSWNKIPTLHGDPACWVRTIGSALAHACS